MAHTFGEEKFAVARIAIDNDYLVRVYLKHYYVTESGLEILISDNMVETLEPGTDLSVDEWYCTDEVRAICAQQWDDESVAEWNAMDEDDKESYR